MERIDSVASFSDSKTLSPSPQNDQGSVSAAEDSGDVSGGAVWGRSGGSIAERRAAKFGFNAASITTARFRTTGPLESPAARSPCLTIPPGISPTALLDSPIMLHNTQGLPSPTTGTFPASSLNHETSIVDSATPADGEKGNDSIFRFKPPARPDSMLGFPSSQNQGTDVDYQTLVSTHQSMEFEFPSGFSKEATSKNCSEDSSGEVKVVESIVPAQSDVAANQIPHPKPIHREDVGTYRPSEGAHTPMETSRTSEDGYNWRKYGQKQVKGSEYPRSYYKCTNPNCQVKKKVERSHDGQITEIIYKSTHNHPKPQPSRRATLGSSFSFNDMSEIGEGNNFCVKAEGGAVWRNIQMGSRDVKLSSDWRADGLERTSSASVLTEVSDPSSTSRVRGVFDSAGTPELSSTLGSHDDDEDEATQGSVSLANDADEEESESKRRKTESCLMETNLTSRAVREPKVVVQIESEVDILDDGYRWRKYGQKVVKGNPNPRSYYKCTSAGCLVRKHVERASHNLKCVITTYEGKHNHEVPAARNSSNVNSSNGNLSSANAQSAVSLARANPTKPESQVQDFAPRFDRKSDFSNQYLRSSLLANYGPPSMYQMKLPPLQQNMTYGSFSQQVGSMASMVPDFPMSLPLGMHQSPNPSLPGFDYNSPEADVRFLRPKQEQRDDNLYDACLPVVDNVNPQSSSSPTSLYGRMMGRFSS